MTSDEFYLEMGFAIKRRDRATAMLNRWTEKLKEAEAQIEVLMLTKNLEQVEEEVPQ